MRIKIFLSLLLALISCPAFAQTDTFSHFVTAAPVATSPIGLGDRIPIVQNGTTHSIPATSALSFLGGGTGVTAPISPVPTVGNVVLWGGTTNGITSLTDSKVGTNDIGALTSTLIRTSGSSVTASAGYHLYTDTNTTGTFNAGAGSFLMEHDFGGMSLTGDRSAMAIVLNQTSAMPTQTFPGNNYSGANIYSLMNFNLGGTDSTSNFTSIGQNFGANIIAQLGAGASNYNGNVGLEVDAQGAAGGSVWKQVGVYSVKIGPVIGTLDAAFAVDAQSGANWRVGLDLGLTTNSYLSNSTIIACSFCNGGVANGIYMPDVTFSGEAIHLGGALVVTGGGNMDIGGNSLAVGSTQNFLLNKGGNGTMFSATGPTGAIANQVTVISSNSGGAAAIVATGSDTNVDLNIAAKGVGSFNIAGKVNLASVVSSVAGSVKTMCVDGGGNLLLQVGVC